MWYLTIAIILFILTFVGGMVYMKKTDEELFGWFDADDLQEVDELLMYSLTCLLLAGFWIAVVLVGILYGILVLIRNLILGRD